jgi:hypothetical protein
LSAAFIRDSEEAEEAVKQAYVRMAFNPWSLHGERRAILFDREGFEIAAVERLTAGAECGSQFRIEIRDVYSGQIVAQRPCDDLEHAVEVYLALKQAVVVVLAPWWSGERQ